MSQSHRTAQGNSKCYMNGQSCVDYDPGPSQIPPYCSGRFQERRETCTRRHRRTAVAIPPYCSGQSQARGRDLSRSLHPQAVAIPPYCRAIPSVVFTIFTLAAHAVPSQSHRTAEGDSKIALGRLGTLHSCPVDGVAIPPYCSGRFQEGHAESVRDCSPLESQSNRTLGNSKVLGTEAAQSLPVSRSQSSNRTAQGNSKIRPLVRRQQHT